MFKAEYIPRYFEPQELVSPEYYDIWGANSYNLFHPHILRCLDNFRASYGSPLTINNYTSGGAYSESGLRNPTTSTGAKRSWHKKGVAFDLKAKDMDKLREFISKYASQFFISRVENFAHTKTWCHVEFSTELVVETRFFNP
jgi:hypothetical protein